MEYAKDGIRVNAVAPGMVDTPLQRNTPREFLKSLSPMETVLNVQEIVDAVIYLAEAPHVTGEVLHVDGGAHIGKWEPSCWQIAAVCEVTHTKVWAEASQPRDCGRAWPRARWRSALRCHQAFHGTFLHPKPLRSPRS
jgi:hypothetical protein